MEEMLKAISDEELDELPFYIPAEGEELPPERSEEEIALACDAYYESLRFIY